MDGSKDTWLAARTHGWQRTHMAGKASENACTPLLQNIGQ